jgi:hypothetical protein
MFVEKQFRDCITYDERIAWLSSGIGQRILLSRPRIKELYDNGKIRYLLSQPEWITKLNGFLLVPNFSRYDSPTVNSSYFSAVSGSSSLFQRYNFPESDKLDLLVHGYVVKTNVIPSDILEGAVTFLNIYIQQQHLSTFHDKTFRPFSSEFTTDPAILDLFYKSPIQSMCDSLFYDTATGVPHSPTLIHQAQIALRSPQVMPGLGGIFGFRSKPMELDGKRWHIDGLAQSKHSPFSLLVGVALSDQLREFSGNLCVFPGSHHSLQPFLQEFVRKGYLNQLETDGKPLGPHMIEEFSDKPVLDRPTQVLLAKGDVVLVHQKVAHRGGPNYSKDSRNMIYFRVTPFDHFQKDDACLSNIWIEFKGMKEVL